MFAGAGSPEVRIGAPAKDPEMTALAIVNAATRGTVVQNDLYTPGSLPVRQNRALLRGRHRKNWMRRLGNPSYRGWCSFEFGSRPRDDCCIRHKINARSLLTEHDVGEEANCVPKLGVDAKDLALAKTSPNGSRTSNQCEPCSA